MKCIALVGYMCVGKTTVGKALAKDLGIFFYDLDWYIEHRYRRKISEIFADEGEAKFRDLERRMLHEVAEFEDVVLSCGGGTPTYADNMAYLNSVAETFYLKATPETILAHLAMSRGSRPLLDGKSPEELETYVRTQLEAREPFYSQAQHVIDVNILDSFEKISDVVGLIQKEMQQSSEERTKAQVD